MPATQLASRQAPPGGGALPSTAGVLPGANLGVLPDLSSAWLSPVNSVYIPWSGFTGQTGQLNNGGTGSSAQPGGPITGMPMNIELGTGTISTGGAMSSMKAINNVSSARGTIYNTHWSALVIEQVINIPILSVSGEVFEYQVGFVQPQIYALAPANYVSAVVNGATLALKSSSNSTVTTGADTYTIAANTSYRVRCVWNPTAGTASLYVNGTLVTSLTTGLPALSTSVSYDPCVRLAKSAGTTSRTAYFGMGYFFGVLL